jgi:hypothetical protein
MGISPGRGLLIPLGYLHPRKSIGEKASWISLISKTLRTVRSGGGKNFKKMVKRF